MTCSTQGAPNAHGQPHGRALGLDVGARRIGVAVSDPLQIVARPLEVIDRSALDAIDRLQSVCREHNVCVVVVGLPLHSDGRLSAQAEQAMAFAEQLQTALCIPVVLHDERFSTQEARQILNHQRRQRMAYDDAWAAAVVLQRYLDARAFAQTIGLPPHRSEIG